MKSKLKRVLIQKRCTQKEIEAVAKKPKPKAKPKTKDETSDQGDL